MSDYKIESSIAIAPRKYENQKYPFATMKIGDSFSLRTDKISEYHRVYSAIVTWNRRHAPMKFVLRKDPKRGGGYRCWRIA